MSSPVQSESSLIGKREFQVNPERAGKVRRRVVPAQMVSIRGISKPCDDDEFTKWQVADSRTYLEPCYFWMAWKPLLDEDSTTMAREAYRPTARMPFCRMDQHFYDLFQRHVGTLYPVPFENNEDCYLVFQASTANVRLVLVNSEEFASGTTFAGTPIGDLITFYIHPLENCGPRECSDFEQYEVCPGNEFE